MNSAEITFDYCSGTGKVRGVNVHLPDGDRFKTEHDVTIHDMLHRAMGDTTSFRDDFSAGGITVWVGGEVCMTSTTAVRDAWETDRVAATIGPSMAPKQTV